MLVMGVNPGHDGAICVIENRRLLFCLESEKDSYPRHTKVTPMTTFDAMERIGGVPDVIAFGGSIKEWFPGQKPIGTGYLGSDVKSHRESTFMGEPITVFSSSHIRSHIAMAVGLAPRDDAEQRAVLCWEGDEGTFYLLDRDWKIVREIPVLRFPGGRYALAFAIADPRYPDNTIEAHGDDSGKLMALAAYGDPADADSRIVETVEKLLHPQSYGLNKSFWRDAPFYNVGVEAQVTKTAAALLHERMFELFANVAQQELPEGIPLHIGGGCGLNCDWNTAWRELGHFSSVFVPPCANDSGSALGHALDALHTLTGDPRIDWDVYCGNEFEWDRDPDAARWVGRPLGEPELADAIAGGSVVAWVQGRWELGPRALGNRSLLAEPFRESTRDLLNDIKQREAYRPIAPCCRLEDVGKLYDRDFHDPYMLYFRMATTSDLKAVTHVDGSARVQTVSKESNRPQHDLLSAFAERHGVGVLCNTSLNYKQMGFVNRMSDLADYCEARGVFDMVVGRRWFQRVEAPVRLTGPGPLSVHLVRMVIEQNVPEGATVLVVSEGIDGMLNLNRRIGWHFPQNEDGSFRGGHPADSDDAIAQIEELRRKGASHFVIPKPDLWWLDFYGGLREQLETRYRSVLQDEGCVIFALADQAPPLQSSRLAPAQMPAS
jgi:hydroxymethyl cephem carbamoyltransferase